MKILVASDSFKGTLSSKNIGVTFKKVFEDEKDIIVDYIEISDGGEGLIEAISSSFNGTIEEVQVIGPLGNIVKAKIGFSEDNSIAVIEMAQSSGITLVENNKLNPLKTTTYGLGQLIKYALDKNVSQIIMGIGGSATNDGGTGMLQALGVAFINDTEITDYMNGELLGTIKSIDMSNLDSRLKNVSIKIACDVTNPLVGEKGATYIFGYQKGGTIEILDQLEKNMLHYANVVENLTGKNIRQVAGGGAAGGVGSACYSFFDAQLKSGIELVLDTIDFDTKVKAYDLVITGEGKMDAQSVDGKAPHGVLKVALKHNKKIMGVCGIKSDEDILLKAGFKKIFPIVPEYGTVEQSISEPSKYFEKMVVHIKEKIVGGNYEY